MRELWAVTIVLGLCCTVTGPVSIGLAQSASGGQRLRWSAVTVTNSDVRPETVADVDQPLFVNPYAKRPVCASMFLKNDWQLSFKQGSCDWLQNRLFSTNAMLAAVWSAQVSKVLDTPSERSTGFPMRFSRKFVQNAFKSTGAYMGGMLFREDPRTVPPYLVLRTKPLPHGFLKRTAHALGTNFVSYRCDGDCRTEADIKTVPALSRVVGSVASGLSSELWTANAAGARDRVVRGAVSAYAATFINSLFVEFKPELSALGGKIFTKVLGVK